MGGCDFRVLAFWARGARARGRRADIRGFKQEVSTLAGEARPEFSDDRDTPPSKQWAELLEVLSREIFAGRADQRPVYAPDISVRVFCPLLPFCSLCVSRCFDACFLRGVSVAGRSSRIAT